MILPYINYIIIIILFQLVGEDAEKERLLPDGDRLGNASRRDGDPAAAVGGGVRIDRGGHGKRFLGGSPAGRGDVDPGVRPDGPVRVGGECHRGGTAPRLDDQVGRTGQRQGRGLLAIAQQQGRTKQAQTSEHITCLHMW